MRLRVGAGVGINGRPKGSITIPKQDTDCLGRCTGRNNVEFTVTIKVALGQSLRTGRHLIIHDWFEAPAAVGHHDTNSVALNRKREIKKAISIEVNGDYSCRPV